MSDAPSIDVLRHSPLATTGKHVSVPPSASPRAPFDAVDQDSFCKRRSGHVNTSAATAC